MSCMSVTSVTSFSICMKVAAMPTSAHERPYSCNSICIYAYMLHAGFRLFLTMYLHWPHHMMWCTRLACSPRHAC